MTTKFSSDSVENRERRTNDIVLQTACKHSYFNILLRFSSWVHSILTPSVRQSWVADAKIDQGTLVSKTCFFTSNLTTVCTLVPSAQKLLKGELCLVMLCTFTPFKNFHFAFHLYKQKKLPDPEVISLQLLYI